MNRKTTLMITSALALLATAADPVPPGVRMIDDFETYTDGQVIASGARSTPWLRFGMIGDNLFATADADQVLAGKVSAKVPVDITTAAGGATIARHFDAPTDLSSYVTATAKVKSLAAAKSTAAVRLSISDGTTTYLSTEMVALTTEVQTATFAIDAKHLARVDGRGALPVVLKGATAIGLRICNGVGETATKEVVVIDDVALHATVAP